MAKSSVRLEAVPILELDALVTDLSDVGFTVLT